MARCLFLPDNLMAVLYEEQRLIQGLLNFPFRKMIPLFKTEKDFEPVTVFPPVLSGTCVLRPCGSADSDEGFILGDARSEGPYIMSMLDTLKQATKTRVFSTLHCKSRYYADVEITEEPETNLVIWTVKNKGWHKAD